jgi:hypothetical protein
LASLEAMGPPPHGLQPRDGHSASALLRRLGVEEADLAEIVAELPSDSRDETIWWLLERAVHGVLLDIDDPHAIRRMPALPMHLGPVARLFWIYAFLAAVEPIRQWHADHGVPDQVSWDTLADLGRQIRLFRQRTGRAGLDNQWWLSLHFRGALFALGRLQFNPFRLCTGPAGPLFWYDGAVLQTMAPEFQRGAPALGVHIPQAGPLTVAACDAAFSQAGTFFATHFPEDATNIAVCTSWLLDEQLADYLPADSNIVSFQRRFSLVPGSRQADSAPFQFVFGKSHEAAGQIEPRTSLERTLIAHLASGGHWHLRTGWLKLGP